MIRYFVVFFIAMNVGNYMGDRLTLTDCATRGKAVMFGGGEVECSVVKEEK